jgi:hypothetical protein
MPLLSIDLSGKHNEVIHWYNEELLSTWCITIELFGTFWNKEAIPDRPADWSSGVERRLERRNQWSRVQIPVVSFCNEQLNLLTSHGCLYILLSI